VWKDVLSAVNHTYNDLVDYQKQLERRAGLVKLRQDLRLDRAMCSRW